MELEDISSRDVKSEMGKITRGDYLPKWNKQLQEIGVEIPNSVVKNKV